MQCSAHEAALVGEQHTRYSRYLRSLLRLRALVASQHTGPAAIHANQVSTELPWCEAITDAPLCPCCRRCSAHLYVSLHGHRARAVTGAVQQQLAMVLAKIHTHARTEGLDEV